MFFASIPTIIGGQLCTSPTRTLQRLTTGLFKDMVILLWLTGPKFTSLAVEMTTTHAISCTLLTPKPFLGARRMYMEAFQALGKSRLILVLLL